MQRGLLYFVHRTFFKLTRYCSMIDGVTISLFFLLAVVVSGVLARMIPVGIPLPLVQIALGALIAFVNGVLFPQSYTDALAVFCDELNACLFQSSLDRSDGSG